MQSCPTPYCRRSAASFSPACRKRACRARLPSPCARASLPTPSPEECEVRKLEPGEFYMQAFQVFQRYGEDNAWFSFEDAGSTIDLAAPVSFIFAASRAYYRVCDNALEMLILGDSKLRTDHDLVFNFGLSSANGVQELVKKENETEKQK